MLVAVSSLLLAAPFGWCCYVPAMVRAATNVRTDDEAPRCPHCPAPSRDPSADETPAPAEPMQCPCLEKQAPTQPAAEKFQPGSVVLAGFTPVAVPTFTASLTAVPVPTIDSSPPLHLTNCVWLC